MPTLFWVPSATSGSNLNPNDGPGYQPGNGQDHAISCSLVPNITKNDHIISTQNNTRDLSNHLTESWT
jgi:hypothetical protein